MIAGETNSRTKYLRIVFASLLMVHGAALNAAAIDLRKPVQTESGLVEGVQNANADVVAFKGIPYAAPPVGNLRWREPQPSARWEGVRKAESFGSSCPQPINACTPPYTAEFSVTGAMNEDCLYLNVWIPAKPSAEPFPVLFYIHGGSGTHGSGSVPVYDGENLAKKGIIVVTFNFRLGILAGFGHPQLSAESPHHVCGNYGLLDMIAALKWVHNNIAAFGGDPDKVTICGQSSGCMAAHYLTTSPLAKGMFRGLIAVSFAYDYLTKPHMIPKIAQKEANGQEYVKIKKCESLDDLRKIPALDLIIADPAVVKAKLIHLNAGIAIDSWAFPLDYPEALDKGLESDVPTITGITADDAGCGPPLKYIKTNLASFTSNVPQIFAAKKDAFLALYPATNDQTAREMSKLSQVEYRMATVFYWARRRSKTAKTPVYTYIFDQPIPWPEHPEFGAFHSSDLIYEFNNLNKMDRPWTDEDRRVADEASSYWVNFVKTGNPNGDKLPVWNAFDPNSPTTMTIGKVSGPREIAGKERIGFYREILEK